MSEGSGTFEKEEGRPCGVKGSFPGEEEKVYICV